jgi:hypothetical protein
MKPVLFESSPPSPGPRTAGAAKVFAAEQRFTLDGSAQLEDHLFRTCQSVLKGLQAAILPARLEAVLLGGGYGRGEGGVLKTPAGDQPYNDLEFYVVLRGNTVWNERRYRAPLHALAESLTATAGVEVEFKIISRARLENSPASMFYYDLLAGHRRLLGDELLFAHCQHLRNPEQIPWSEGTRLLMNRCSGLLFAKDLLRQKTLTQEQTDFVGRNLAKAQLALGDAVLTVAGAYHWSCQERHRRLLKLPASAEDMPWLKSLQQHHAAGLGFKLHPYRTTASREILASQFEPLSDLSRQVWLWLESRRIQRPFSSVREYALLGLNKCPETRPWRNSLLNLRSFGPRAVASGKFLRYPRERVFNALSLLLWEPAILDDPRWLRRLQQELQTSATAWPDLLSAYRNLWRCYN